MLNDHIFESLILVTEQVKYFKKADCPAKVGGQTSNYPHLEASHSYHVVSDGGSSNLNLQIPQVPWKTPPKFILRSDWHVAAGEESVEKEVQKRRETSVLEAFYPRLSSIPPCPFMSLNTEGQLIDDTYTPILPINPEETAEIDLSSSAPSDITIDSSPENLLQGPSISTALNISPCKFVSTPEPSNNGKSALAVSQSLKDDIVIATVAAANAILKSKEPGSMIDTDLLVQLLKNPEMLQELINKHLPSSTTNTEISESKAFVYAVPMESSQLPIDKSDNGNGKHANAETEAIPRPLVIKLSSSAKANSGTVSGPKPTQSSVSLLRSTNDYLIKSISHENNQPENGGNLAAKQKSGQLVAANAGTGKSSSLKQVTSSVSQTSSFCDLLSEKSTRNQSISTGSQTVTKPVNQFSATNPESGRCSQPKQMASSVSLSCSAPDLQCMKPINEHGQLANIRMLKPVLDEVGTGSAPKSVIPSVSLLMSVCDLPGKKSTTDLNQQAYTKNMVPKPVMTQPVVVDADFATGFGEKTPSVSFPITVHDLPCQNSTNEHNQQVNSGNEVAAKPVVTQSFVVNNGTGSGFRIKAVTPPVPLPSLTHNLQSKRSTTEQHQQVCTGNMVVATPEVTQSIAVNTRTGTGIRIKPGMRPMSVYELPGEKSSYEANAVAELLAENQPFLVPRTNALINAVALPVENRPPSIPRINVEFLGKPNFGSSTVAKPVHLTGQNLEISRLKKLIDEHGAHVEGGHASVAGINPIFPNPSKPDFGMLKEMVSEYGSHDNTEIPLPRSEHLLVPSPVAMFDAFSPMEHRQPPKLFPAPFSASSLMEFEPKIQKPCLYYNTPKGCRKGSSCRFLHDPSNQWSTGGVSEAPKTKRMKPGGELIGRI